MMMNASPKKLRIIRFFINPISLKTLNPNSCSPTASSPITPSIHPYFSHHRSFSSVVSENNRAILIKNGVFSPKLIDVVKNNSKGYNLDLKDKTLSTVSICQILRVLSCEKVPALWFFESVRDTYPQLYRNSDVCSLVIDNCGWLNDFDTMRMLLKRFKHERICLNDKAFGFLPVLDSSKARAMESVSLVVHVLGEIGGSVHSSGVYGLITMLCGIDCFELAKYVIEITERKVSYYAVLVREKCRRGRIAEARGLVKEMRAEGCEPDAKIYNHILGTLCKLDMMSEAQSLLDEMKETGVEADEITFEILISHACRLGKIEMANESFDRLISTGRVARLSTYAVIVKGYFNAGRYEEAYTFVRDIEAKKMPQVHKVFSLLARLHRKKGNVDAAARILDEMMEKGLKPEFSNYAKTVRVLRHSGGKDVAYDLRNKFSKFRVE